MVSRIRQCSAIGPICRSMRYSGRITMIAVERPKLVTTVQKTWEKECGQMQIKHMK